MAGTQQTKSLIIQQGSKVTESDGVPFVTTVDKDNSTSSYLVVYSTTPKIDYTEVVKSIDVEVSELKPNIPQSVNEFIPREQYNLLLSQSVDLNNTINSLRLETEEMTNRITELEGKTDEEISNRLNLQQTNKVLVNQLTSLSQTIDGFAEQISTALQKSIEESIFRTSLQAQNKGYEAQIQALITQADSLNAIITGLYAQLGASIVQLGIENEAQSLAATAQGDNINEVVVTKQNKGTWLVGTTLFQFYAVINNEFPATEQKWRVGGNLTFRNVNKVPVKIRIEVFHPRKSNGNPIKFFKFYQESFTIGPEEVRAINAIYTPSDPELQYTLSTNAGDPKSASIFQLGSAGLIKITVNNESTGIIKDKSYNLALGLLHPNSYN